MTGLGLIVLGWIAGVLTTGLGLFVWALVEDSRHPQDWRYEEQPWWEKL